MTGINKKIDWLRMVLCAAVLFLVLGLLFSFYEGKGADIISELSADGKSPNLVWLAEHIFAAIPVLMLIIISELFFLDKSRYVPIYTQVEKLVIFSAAAIFTYGILLVGVIAASPETIDPETGEAIKTLWDRTNSWFFAQILPFLIVISYHAIRIGTEKAELFESASKECDDDDADEEAEVDDE